LKVQKKSELNSDPDVSIQHMQRAPVVKTINEVISLEKDLNIDADEVYLKANTLIYTNQFNLHIKARLIVVEQGAIFKTFTDDKLIAAFNTPAVNGGLVKINVNKIEGNLTVVLNGQQGGQGMGGWDYFPGSQNMFFPSPAHQGCAPESGQNSGVSGSFHLEAQDALNFFFKYSMIVAVGGLVGDIHNGAFPIVSLGGFNLADYKAKHKNFEYRNCEHKPQVGKPGQSGSICMKLSDTDRPSCEKFY
jgi:hypothetical protein